MFLPSSGNIPTEVVWVLLDPLDPSKTLLVGVNLSNTEKDALIECLAANLDCFVWCIENITRISREVITHKLNIYPTLSLKIGEENCNQE